MCRKLIKRPPVPILRLALTACALSLWPWTARGQSAETQPASTQPTTTQATEVSATLTRDEIQAQLSRIEAAAELPEGVRVEAANLYRQALDQLAQAETWSRRAAEFRKGREEAPTLLEDSRRRLQEAAAVASQPATQEAPADTSLEQLTQQLAAAEAELKTRQDNVRQLDEEARQRADRRTAIPDMLAGATNRLESASRGLGETPGGNSAPQSQLARRALLTSQRAAAQEETHAYQEELQFYDARSEVLAVRRDEARTLATLAETKLNALRKLVTDKREAEVARQREQARAELERAPEAIRDLAQRNSELAKEWEQLGEKIKATEADTQTIERLTAALVSEFATLKKQSALAEATDLLGPLMRKQRTKLAELRRYERELDQTRSEYARADLRQREIVDEGDVLLNLDEAVSRELEELTAADPSLSAADFRPKLEELLTSRRDVLRKVQRDYDAYSTDLIEKLTALGALSARIDEIELYTKERGLWVPSAAPIYKISVPPSASNLLSATQALVRAWLADARRNAWAYVLTLLAFLALMSRQVRLRRQLHRDTELIARPLSDRYALTVRALFDTLAIALPGPFIFWAAGWRLGQLDVGSEDDAFELARAASTGLLFGGSVLFGLLAVRHACRKFGLFACHFRWNAHGVGVLRRQLIWFAPFAGGLAMVVSAAEVYADPAWSSSVGRLAFIILMILTAIFAWRTLSPKRGAFAQYFAKNVNTLIFRSKWATFTIVLLLPVFFAGASAAGYHYTAVALSLGLVRTVFLTLLLALAHALAVRWVFYTQRRLAIEEARRKRAELAAQAAESDSDSEAPAASELVLDEAKLKIGDIGEQTRQLLSSAAWLGVLVILWVSWADLVPALSFLSNVALWSYTSQAAVAAGDDAAQSTVRTVVETITLANILLALLVVFVTSVMARNIPGLLEIVILRRMPLDTGTRFAVSTVSRYLIVVIGVAIAFAAVGVGWSKVQWLVAAITVGLGFGLQEIFANFVSGLILLFERPLRIGDTVTVGGVTGTVSRIRIRATTITDWDRKELVIPNKEFVTGQVVNWSLSDQVLRLTVRVGIAYGSDVETARRILLDVALENRRVLAQPKPQVWFWEFGDSSLNFELRVFVKDIDDFVVVRDALHTAIDAAFRKAGVEIAFPQRDIHIRSTTQAAPVATDTGSGFAPAE